MICRCGTLVMAALLSGCASFNETHYFKSLNRTGQPVNYFRLTVTGNAGWSSARYIASCFDERAVDLFFNELKSPGKILPAKPAKPGSDSEEVSYELDSCKRPGAFVMILSTNADAVANTIGNFAESNVTAEAITNLANRNQVAEVRRLDAAADAVDGRLAAVSAELKGLFDKVPAGADRTSTEDAYVRILNSIGRVLGAPAFKNMAEATTWVDNNRQRFSETR